MNYIEQAYKGKTHWWRYVVTMVVVFTAIQLGSIPLVFVALFESDFDMVVFAQAAADNFLNLGINSSLYLFLMVLTFIAGLVLFYVSVVHIHVLKFRYILTARKQIDYKRVLFSFVLWGAISASFIAYNIWVSPENYIWNFKPIPFVVLLLVSFVFLPFQTSFEELIFRGYLMQGLGILAENRWFPLFVTSVVFGLLHWFNPEVEKLGPVVMVYYVGTGFLLGISTLMDEGLELALGFHAANNIFAAFLVTTDWMVFRTDALFRDVSEPSTGIELFVPVFVFYPIVLLVFSKKYGWKNWKEKLTGSIQNTKMIQ